MYPCGLMLTELTTLIWFLYLSPVLLLILFHPFLSENDETGVMDSLLEALQSGAAFRDRRKRAPRPRGESHILTFLYTDNDTDIKPSIPVV